MSKHLSSRQSPGLVSERPRVLGRVYQRPDPTETWRFRLHRARLFRAYIEAVERHRAMCAAYLEAWRTGDLHPTGLDVTGTQLDVSRARRAWYAAHGGTP